MAGRHEAVSPKLTFSKKTATTAATATAAGVLFGIGAPIAVASDSTEQDAVAVAVAIETAGTVDNNVATVELNGVSAGEWEMETITLEAEAPVVVARPAPAPARATRAAQQVEAAAPQAQTFEAPQAVSGSASSVLATALSYTGSPYRWGGTTPAGWDCIGFVRYIYAQHGVSIGGSTTSVLSVGRQVSYSEVQPGDILYWPGHVGISLGNGTHVGAWNPSMGTTVGPDRYIGTPIVIRVFG